MLSAKDRPNFSAHRHNALMRNDNAAGCQQVFDHPQTERKSKVQPNGTGNAFRRKPVAAIKRITGSFCHADRWHIVFDSPSSLRCHCGASSPPASTRAPNMPLHQSKRRLLPKFGKIDAQTKSWGADS
jgi:hypothetical protein